MLKRISVFIIILIFFILVKTCNATDNDLKNATRAYFCSEITKSGDCTLLENYDANGEKIYGLIDTGNHIVKYDEDGNITHHAAIEYLRTHGVKNLEFIIITHQHKDHTGNLVDILDYIYQEAGGKVKKIYMKEADSVWASGNVGSDIYYDSLKKIIQYNIKVVGSSILSLKSEIISPTMFTEEYKGTQNGFKEENFEGFTYDNIKFNFGSAKIRLFNWQIFDQDGNVISVKDDTCNDEQPKMIRTVNKKAFEMDLTKDNYNREIATNENNNSLGILLTQGEKKAFFGGDLNNIKKPIGIGDEDRIKDAIGDIDFYKVNHHGFEYSNTADFLNTIKPEYAIITNAVGKGTKTLKDYLKENNVKYLYSTIDSIGVSATITENDVCLGLEKPGEVKNINNNLYYIPERYKPYEEYEDYLYEISYNEESLEVSNWEELKKAIEDNMEIINECIESRETVNHEQKKIEFPKLKINLKTEDWVVNSITKKDENNKEIETNNITIEETQNIELNSNQNINIIRGEKYKVAIFDIKGDLSIGEKIIIDGNKDNVSATDALITVNGGTLDLFGIVQNNLNSRNDIISKEHRCAAIGSGIRCYSGGTINIYDKAKISNNIQRASANYSISENTYNKRYGFYTYGSGVYLYGASTLNMYGGEISSNIAINESIVTNKNRAFKKSIWQNCYGAGIYSDVNSEINLLGGKIINNSVKNNAKIKLETPDEGNECYISGIMCAIAGVGVCAYDSKLNISGNFEISNNNASFNYNIDKSNNTSINGSTNCYLRGGQVYCSGCDLNINEATIKNGENATKIINTGDIEKVNEMDRGGAIWLGQQTEFYINKLNIESCKTNGYGGAMYFGTCSGKIENSVIKRNNALKGAGLYNSAGEVEMKETKILGNEAEEYGGGIYNEATIILINTSINKNIAEKYSGGGICIEKGKVVMDGIESTIDENTAQKAGGGIFNESDGIFAITKGEIKNNTAKTNEGGGVYNKDGKFYKKEDAIITSNISPNSNQNGIDIYSTKDILTDTNKPTIKEIITPTEYVKRRADVSFKVSDDIGVKEVKVNGKELPNDGGYQFTASKNATYTLKVLDFFENEISQQFEVSQIVKPGDANSDNVVDFNDILQMNKHRLKKLTLQEKEKVAADLNDDGNVDIFDIFKLNKYRLNKINSL